MDIGQYFDKCLEAGNTKARAESTLRKMLKPCPLCGGGAKVKKEEIACSNANFYDFEVTWRIGCEKCNLKRNSFKDLISRECDDTIRIEENGLKQAIEDWNSLGHKDSTLVAVGDTVYAVYLKPESENVYFEEFKVLEVSNKRFWTKNAEFNIDNIGVDVFLTAEEAEQSVEQLKEELNIL